MVRFNEIQFIRLDDNNFTGRSLDFFVRHQAVTECWRRTDSGWKLVPISYEENWSLEQCRGIAEDVALHMNHDQTGFGAFIDGRIVGFATVSHHIFGVTARYAELVCFQISEEYRRQDIGKKLFSMVCEEAIRLGAECGGVGAEGMDDDHRARPRRRRVRIEAFTVARIRLRRVIFHALKKDFRAIGKPCAICIESDPNAGAIGDIEHVAAVKRSRIRHIPAFEQPAYAGHDCRVDAPALRVFLALF